MAESPIDLESLLSPLSTGVDSAGMDLRSDYSPESTYQRLRDARSAARSEERMRDSEGSDSPVAEAWQDVLGLAQHALATQTKDFEIAGWMTEALVRIAGFPGLRAGALLIAGLCERFWETGFPQQDEEGWDARASPIGGLAGGSADGTIMQPLRRLPLFRRADGTTVGLYQWDIAEQTAGLSEERMQARYAAGVPDLTALAAEARLDQAYLMEIGQQVAAAMDAWQSMGRVLDSRFGDAAPSTRRVWVLLEQAHAVVVRLGGDAPAPAPVTADTPSLEPIGTSNTVLPAAPVASGGAVSAIQTREDALRELNRIAEYFRRTEPHSPLAFTLEEAVRRGRMTLPELLSEVLPNEEERNSMLWRLGMRPQT